MNITWKQTHDKLQIDRSLFWAPKEFFEQQFTINKTNAVDAQSGIYRTDDFH